MLTRTKLQMDSTFEDDLDADSLDVFQIVTSYRG